MVYTEIKTRSSKKYYYRVKSIRNGKIISKQREYLGANLSKEKLLQKEKEADKRLIKTKHKKIIQEIEKIKQKVIKILKKNKIKRAGIFGSYARGEQNKNSDIDILADIPKNINLFDFVGIKLELEDNLGKKIDLVEYKAVKPMIKERILNEEIRIL